MLAVEKGETLPLFRSWLIFFVLLVVAVSVICSEHYRPKRIIVAVVDTGLDLKQIKFKFISTQGVNIFNPDDSPQDDNGHGTQISSALHFFESRIKIMPIKAIPKSGVATKQDLARGIVIAVDRGANIINVSAGVVSPSSDLENAVKYAKEKGVLIVAAVGGNGTNIEYPAAYSSVIAVGGVDPSGAKLSNSNIGAELDLVALGKYATIGLRGECQRGAGTSLATPIVSAYVAKILMRDPNLKAEEVMNVLLDSVRDIGEPGKDHSTGYGLLNYIETTQNVCR